MTDNVDDIPKLISRIPTLLWGELLAMEHDKSLLIIQFHISRNYPVSFRLWTWNNLIVAAHQSLFLSPK
jgi:hypothetical protein